MEPPRPPRVQNAPRPHDGSQDFPQYPQAGILSPSSQVSNRSLAARDTITCRLATDARLVSTSSMQRCVAFLGGINLGRRRVAMQDLKKIVEEAGLEDVSTFIASGNVIFRAGRRSAEAVEGLLEKQLHARLGYVVPTFVRREEEICAMLEARPFRTVEAKNTFSIILCKDAVPAAAKRTLTSFTTPPDQFHVDGREIYWLTQAGISDSTVWTRPEIKSLKLPPSTMRNRNTLERLAQKYQFGTRTRST